MGSSVSSERAFSSAGITVSKLRNRLNPDIVEALQFRKCMLRKNLIFREVPSSVLEDTIEMRDDCEEEDARIDVEVLGEESWDSILTDTEEY